MNERDHVFLSENICTHGLIQGCQKPPLSRDRQPSIFVADMLFFFFFFFLLVTLCCRPPPLKKGSSQTRSWIPNWTLGSSSPVVKKNFSAVSLHAAAKMCRPLWTFGPRWLPGFLTHFSRVVPHRVWRPTPFLSWGPSERV